MINVKKFKRTSEPSSLEKEIERLFAKLADLPENSDDYNKVSDQVKKLYPLKEVDSKKKVSSDVLVSAASNLVGIVMILNYEHIGNIVQSKALGMLGRKLH